MKANYCFSRFFVISTAIAISACGSSGGNNNNASTGPAPVLNVSGFESFVSKYEAQSVQQGNPVTVNNLVIQFGPMATEAERGVCEVSSDSPPTITLDQAYWENVDEPAQESLIFHEMGHCVRRRLHVANQQADGDPSSLMFPYTIDSATYTRNYATYMPEMYNNGPYF